MQFEYDKRQLELSNHTFKKIKAIGDTWDNATLLGEWMSCNKNGKYICTLKMNSGFPAGVMVGIVANPCDITRNMYYTHKNGYVVDASGRNWVHGESQKKIKFPQGAGSSGDLYVLTLDLEASILYFEITNENGMQKGEFQFAVKKASGIQYKFGVSLCSEGLSVTVVDIKQMPQKRNVEQKEFEQVQLQDEIKLLKQKVAAVEQNKTNMIRKKDVKIENLKNEILSVTQSQNEKKIQINELNEALKLEKQKNKKLEKKMAILEDEQKQLIMDNTELKKENKLLKMRNLNTDKYLKWSAEEIVCWIISLDAKIYQKYESKLMKALSEDNMNGSCLPEVDAGDIKLWGINDFMHRKKLLKSIQQLTTKQNNNYNKNKDNEGVNAPTAYI